MSNLASQLGAAAALMMVTAVIHGAGVAGIAHLLGLDRRRSKVSRLHPRTVATLSAVGLLLFGLHMAEIALFALFYLVVDAARSLEVALYVSASAYSTLGQADFPPPMEWRLLAAIEGVIGFLMLGWSTAFFVTDMNKLLRE
jgi:hypothetical protein